ncbi:MAG TPA: amidohydrolase family protein, partial [Planctomycetota bacterium]|nr:amidohydrolase family protein [Planctomycetota bacterium]
MQSSTFFRGALLVTLDPPRVELADLLVADGRVVRKGGRQSPPSAAEIVDARGKILLPGLVAAHVRPAAALGRLLPFPDLEDVDRRVEKALGEEATVCAAFAAALQAVRAGCTTLLVSHAAATEPSGALTRLRDVFLTLGVRFSASYAATDGDGVALDAALQEQRFAAAYGAAHGMRFLLGLGRLKDVSAELLAATTELGRRNRTPLHVELGFDGDAAAAHAEAARLFEAGADLRTAVVLCGPRLDARDATLLRAAGATLVHAPSLDAAGDDREGALGRFAPGGALGAGPARVDLFEEARLAYLRARARGEKVSPADVVSLLAGGAAAASKLFDAPLGTFEPGAAADFVLLDYRPATPLTDESVAAHVLFGFSAAHVVSVMTDGRMVLRDRQFHRVDARNLYRQLQRGAYDLWLRAGEGDYPGLDRERDETVHELIASRGPVAREGLFADAPEIEALPPEEAEGEPWRLRGGDRGGDVDPFARPAAPTRALRLQPPTPFV